MFNKITKVAILVLIGCGFFVGLLSVYRAMLMPRNMTLVTGKVVAKNIYYHSSLKGGIVYCVSFKLANRQDRIAVRLYEDSYIEAKQDSINTLIDTGKTYTFYLDPTIPTSYGDNWGIDKIDYDGAQVFRAPTGLTLFLGIFLSLFCLAAFIAVLKAKKKTGAARG